MTIQTDSRITSEMLTDGLNSTFPYDFPIFKGDNGQKGVEVRFMNDLGYDIVDPSLFLVIDDSDNTSGMVQFYVPPVAGKRLLIAGKTPIDQQLDITNASRFNGKSIETNFDKIVSMIQEFISSLDEEIRQRINNNEELRNKLDLMFTQYIADVDARFNNKWTEIADYLNATLPMFFCIMRKELALYEETGLITAIENILEQKNISQLIDEYIASLDHDFVINTTYFSGAFEFDPSFVAAGGKYPLNAKLKLAGGDEVKSTIPNNTSNPNTDMTNWVKTNSASQVFDASGKTQQFVNDSNAKTIEWFSSDQDALDWVKSSVNNFLYAKAGKTYTLPTGNVYLNRIICLGGIATFKILDGTNLSYINFTDGSEILLLKNIKFLVAGHRGTLTTSTSFLYTSINTVKTANIENIKVFGLTDINNEASWQDDVNMTRMQGFINYRVSESSRISNIECYGVAHFAIVDTVSVNAIHTENNINCYNAETGVYFPEHTWKTGAASNVNIFNNAAQREYWIKRDAAIPLGRNGKNCIMCEADHALSHTIDGSRMIFGIEKSVYCTSIKSVVRNTVDDSCFSMTTIKSPKGAGTPKSNVDAFNLICKNPANTNGVQDTYGWLEGVFERVRIDNAVKNLVKPYIFSDLGNFTYKNIFARNTGIPFYFADGNNVTKLNIIDSEIVDCYDGNLATLYYKDAGVKTIGELNICNTRHYCEDISSVAVANLPNIGALLDGVIKFKCNKLSSFAKVSPFFKGTATTYLEVMASNFTLKNSVLISEMWSNLKSTGTYAPQANIFDFSIDFITTNVTAPQPKVKAQFKKLNNNGIVICADFWSQIDIDYPVSVANGVSLMTIGDKSFELTATFGNKLLKFYWDAIAKTITSIINIGGLFSTTLAADKINIYVNGADNRLIVNIGNGTWTGGAGDLSISVNRF